jgi:acid-sensing ion channel, other
MPWKTLAGDSYGLSITMKETYNSFNICFFPSFFMHNFDELPVNFDTFELCEFKYQLQLDVLISPEVMQTDDDFIEFPIEERQCYTDNERQLRFFKRYTVRNCETECLTLIALEKCSCVAFFMIRNSKMPICGVSVKTDECIRQVVLEVRLKEDEEIQARCNCLPTCNTLTYNFEYVYNEYKNTENETADVTINFRFKDSEFLPLRRHRKMTAIGFMAESAGLLGLYCGISILTIIEVFYFLTMRPLSNFMRRLWGQRGRLH